MVVPIQHKNLTCTAPVWPGGGVGGWRIQDLAFQILFDFSNTGSSTWTFLWSFQSPKVPGAQPGTYYLEERASKTTLTSGGLMSNPSNGSQKPGFLQAVTGAHIQCAKPDTARPRAPRLLASFIVLNDQADPRIERRC